MKNAITCRRGALLGAAVYFGLFVYCLAAHFQFSVMGVVDPELTRVARAYLMGPILWFELKVLLAYLAVGLIMGAFAAGAVGGLAALAKRRLRGPLSAALIVGFILLVHVLAFARSMTLYPQLYAEFMYEKGGVWRALQLMCTDRIGITPIDAALVAVLIVGLTLWLVGSRDRLRAAAGRRARYAVIAAGVVIAVVAGAHFWPTPMRNHGPNLLILGADSVRPDRLSVNGYPRDTSPALDALARRGARFDNAYAQLPRTFPSWVSILTGRYPWQTGITTMFPPVLARQQPFEALPRLLAEQGFATAAVADYAGDVFPRIDLGFQRIDAPTFALPTLAQIRGLEIHTHVLPYLGNRWGRELFPVLKEFASLGNPRFVARDVTRRLRAMRGSERFMITVFMSCTHFPYSPPWPYYRRYTDPNYRGLSKYNKINRINVAEEVTAADIAQVNGLFDGAIRATDDAVAEILAALKKDGLADNTVVVFLADHGENLYEGDAMQGHGDHLRHPWSLKLPLIISDPRRHDAGKTIASRVREIDLFPTLLELMGQPVPAADPGLPPGFAARSLVPYLDSPGPDLPVYAETGLWFIHDGPGFFQKQRLPYPDVTVICGFENYYHQEIVLKDEWRDFTEIAKDRMLIDAGWKVIYNPLPDGVKWELYDLAHDPEENHDVAAERPDELARMQEKFIAFLRTRPGWTFAGGYFLPSGKDVR
jgi:arylsulfatase A-like enzyme